MGKYVLYLILMLINVAAFLLALKFDQQIRCAFRKKDGAVLILLLICTYLCCVKNADYSAVYIAAAMPYLICSAILDHRTGMVYMWGIWELAALFHILYFIEFGQICFTACMAGGGYYLLYRLKAYGKGDVALLTVLAQLPLFAASGWQVQLMSICFVTVLSFGIFLIINLFTGNIQRGFVLKRKMPFGPSILSAALLFLLLSI